ncbi:hypothetical protein WHR41_04642 [Cladosporium halotolerans]|uniref:SPX domain-containing protein n=1 Tax=Cladosporium halotolerans TaxID=1052096 RepID=A0AB34KTY0_9PEZI
MKYGQTLRQRSIPAWSAYNIDYDDIKNFIKERTTPGKGKTVAVPGRSDEQAQAFENDLYLIFEEQHLRIDLFVKSKAREIQHRLEDARKRLRHLAKRKPTADQRIPISRLERYGKLENDVLKAGEEIKSLSRFVGAQRTAFRKLLKKYKKWTGSTHLEERVRREVLDDPKSFTQYDLGPMLDDYSSTLHDIRALYETRLQQATTNKSNAQPVASIARSASIAKLQTSIASGSRTDFDTTFATAPLESRGTLASYFVHPENVVELQVLLLQHVRFLSRSASTPTEISSPPTPRTLRSRDSPEQPSNHFLTAADNPDHFIQEQSAVTVDEREHGAGSALQQTKLCARWNVGEDATAVARTGPSKLSTYRLKQKHVGAFFDKSAPFLPRRESAQGTATELSDVRDVLTSNEDVAPLFSMSSNRSRFVGLSNSDNGILLASLDNAVSFEAANKPESKTGFPFALLQVRHEGTADSSLLTTLDGSHLVERVRGFSMEYHAVWHLFKPSTVAAPFWVTTLTKDIRKLPPATLKRTTSRGTPDAAVSPVAMTTGSNGSSVLGTTDGATTAVETSRHPSMGYGDSESTAPPLRAFRKKRRREYPEAAPAQQQARYWSEYDHPEDGSDAGGDAYVIYIDPNEKSSFELFFEKLGRLFSRKPRDPEPEGLPPTPPTPRDDESSSEDEESQLTARRPKSYGAIPSLSATPRPRSLAHSQRELQHLQLPQFAAVSLVASLVILVVAYLLAATGRHKLATTVDAGVVFAIVSSLIFAVVGLAALWRERGVGAVAWGVAGVTLLVDAVGSGGLLAWILA